jgi:hypothetical protein
MQELDLNTSVGRRGLLQAFALLSLGGLIFGFSETVARPAAPKPAVTTDMTSDVKADDLSEYVVINGWVLPARHFRQTPA